MGISRPNSLFSQVLSIFLLVFIFYFFIYFFLGSLFDQWVWELKNEILFIYWGLVVKV